MALFPSIKQAIDNLTKPYKGSAIQSPDEIADLAFVLDTDFYETQKANWFKAMPYGFRFRDRVTGKDQILFLPISPQNLTIVTHYATNVITTLYGTVEEHSEQRYFDIQIQGTTGIAPRYTLPMSKKAVGNIKANSSQGRTSYGDGSGNRLSIGSNIAGGFFAQTIGIANQVLGTAQDLVLGKESMNVTGMESQDNTGYAAFHRLYKFFLVYKADAAGINAVTGQVNNNPRMKGDDGSAHPLSFLNYKDNNVYDVSIQNFVLRRTNQNPMLYNYEITLRGYNLRGIDAIKADLGGLTDRLNDLGLAGVQSSTLLSSVTDASKSVKQIAGAFLGGVDILGR